MSPPQGQGRVAPVHLALFASLYAVQGVVVAYFFNFNPLVMRAAGVSRETVGWVQSLVLIPFVLKFLAGPLSDRVNPFGLGHRKPYIVLGLVLQILGLIGLSLVDPGKRLGPFTALAVLTVLGLALFDTCCDGMVIDVTPPEDRARVQGTLVAARFIATMVCSWAFGQWLSHNGGLRGVGLVLWVCAGLTLVPLAQTFWVHEPERAADAEAFEWRALAILIRPRSLVLLAFGALYAIIGYGVEINLSQYYGDEGFNPGGDVGNFAAARYLGRAIGAGLLPLSASRFRRRTILLIGIAALAVTTAGQALVGGRASAAAWGFAFGAANGWDDALFNVLAMEASDPRMAASTYALFMAVSNLSVLGGGLFSTAVKAVGGRYRPVFLGAAALLLGALPLVRPLSKPAPKPEPHDALAA